MDFLEIGQRLLLAVVMSGAIGFDREFKSRPAGMRTHILVCVGATMIALLQAQIYSDALDTIASNPNMANAIKIDQTRLIAQVVSGIGFLGAGTIIVTKRSVAGLTTAASLWTVACLGLTVGMGYYELAFVGFVVIQATLSLLKKVIVVPSIKNLEIKYVHRAETKEFIIDYFEKNKVEVKDTNVSVEILNNRRVYTNIYTIEIPKNYNLYELIEELSAHENVRKIKLLDL
ncbi:MgtC/SapB family protein [Vagococcus sp. DIV0080]|uniref:MgtC/SapB family protein n=1 Tax=Candidatus Vagococcus giribetii TaxID=2230876 RepID=A0ABS3HPE6_9ENTE|nr:MgtC/SapB family protein [Vagococcus sp. DIV0080]MBO0475614.1 MgtC/SapB family protein [Vagococcus sp. DIV0080]